MTTITPFAPPHEAVEFDHDTLQALCDRHGDGTEAVIAAMLSQVEALLLQARTQLATGHLGGLRRSAHDLVGLARGIGMRTLERCAIAVFDCVDAGNDTALTPCCDRMLRLGRIDSVERWTVRRDTVA